MKCRHCDEGFVLVSYPVEYVSHDMAIDAGDKRLEGQVYSSKEDYEPCECCHGDFENCENCTQEDARF